MMLKALNTIALTLLVAMMSIIPATFLSPYLPGVIDPALERFAVAGWFAALMGWWIAKKMGQAEKEGNGKGKGNAKARRIGFTVSFLALATCTVALFHFFGDMLV